MIIILIDQEKAAFKAIEEGVKRVNSSDTFKEYLCFLAKFHQYSFHNTILILNQCPHASYVAGYHAWKSKFKRQVNKGEKAIKILAPYQIRKTSDDKQDEYVLTRFKLVNVFDISQTTGENIPSIINELKGESFEAKVLIETIEDASDVPVIYKNKAYDSTLASGARGYYNPQEEVIVIDERLDINQMAKTLCHEFAHSLYHKQSDKTHAIKEIEAEALAFVICHYFHLDTGNYSFPYIASYAAKDEKIVGEILTDIQSKAHETIELLKPLYHTKSVLTKRTNPKIFTGNSLTSLDVK